MNADVAELKVSVLSRVGGRARNEDACGYWSAAGRGCYVLADGAGGHGGGDVASRIAVEEVLSAFAATSEVSPRSVAGLLERANAAVLERQRTDRTVDDMRSTVVVLQIDTRAGAAVWGHLGDSRLYRFRDGRVVERTRDHSLVQDMIDAGFVSSEAAAKSPDRNVLTGSLGSVDTFFPDVRDAPRELRAGDAFLMCSDGFWDHVDTDTMERTLTSAEMPDEWLRRMEQHLLPRLREGSDNYSAIAVLFGDPDPSTRLYEPPAASGASPGAAP